MELDVTSAFATLIGRLRVPDADVMDPGLLVVFPFTGCTPWLLNSGERQHSAAIRVRKGERQ